MRFLRSVSRYFVFIILTPYREIQLHAHAHGLHEGRKALKILSEHSHVT
jgi:hypothetical protein